jgi:hypothetical protein
VPGGVPGEITAGRAGQVLASVTPAGAADAVRWELAAELTEDLRGAGARIRETRKKAAAAVAAAGTSLTGLSGVGPVIAAAVIGDVRQVSRFGNRDRFAACNGTAPIEVSSGGRKACRLSRRGNRRLNHAIHMAAVTQIRYRHTKGRACYDKKLAEGKPPERGAARAQTPDQRRYLRLPAGRHPARGRRDEPGRATGEPLCNQGGRLAPRPPALRASHSRARHPPYDPCRSLSRAAALPCERADGSRTGRSPAAQRRPQGVPDAAASEPIMPATGKRGRPPALTLKQRGVRSGRRPQ